MTRTYWLSFVDGGKNLGIAILDVTDEEAALALLEQPEMFDKVNGPWVVAATRKAWATGCNPGGEVASWRIDGAARRAMLADLPRNRLMSRQELDAWSAKWTD